MKATPLVIGLFVFLCAASPQANALIFWNQDNSANQTDPGDGVPWDSVGRVAGTDLSLSSSSGSAIYLGAGFMLTANHVTLGASQRVTFDGVTSFSVDMTFNSGTGSKQVASDVDLKVFKLTSFPSVTVVNLGSSSPYIADTTLIGYGVGRGATPLETDTVAWGAKDTVAKRWGINVPRQLANISYSGYNYTAIVSVMGSGTSSPAGVGDNEAGLSVIDSGSGMFQKISGTWYLMGVGATVSQQAGADTTTFDRDSVSGSNQGDKNYHVSVSTYRDDILAIIPEPTTGWLISTAGIAIFLIGGVKRRRFLRDEPRASSLPKGQRRSGCHPASR